MIFICIGNILLIEVLLGLFFEDDCFSLLYFENRNVTCRFFFFFWEVVALENIPLLRSIITELEDKRCF